MKTFLILAVCVAVASANLGKLLRDFDIDDFEVKNGTGNSTEPECGNRNVTTARIVNGDDAPKGSWPWQISLRYLNSRHVCGGSVLNGRYIITAAHCIGSKTPSLYTVRVGEHQQSKNEGDHQDIRVKTIYMHPGWKGTTGSILNDAAILELTTEIDYTYGNVAPICLPSSNAQFLSNSDCYVTGWGFTNPYVSRIADILQELRTDVITNSACNSFSTGWGGRVKTTQICTTTPNASACRGDSGGPLACNINGRYYLAGLVSWGSSNCRGRPNVFTRVTSFLDFINDTVY